MTTYHLNFGTNRHAECGQYLAGNHEGRWARSLQDMAERGKHIVCASCLSIADGDRIDRETAEFLAGDTRAVITIHQTADGREATIVTPGSTVRYLLPRVSGKHRAEAVAS